MSTSRQGKPPNPYGCFSIWGAQFLVVVVESVSLGVCLTHVVLIALNLKKTDPPLDHVLALGFVAAAAFGYLVTVPLYCCGLLRKKPILLTPYLIWRIILTVMTLAIGLALTVLLIQRGVPPEWVYWRVIPGTALASIVGVLFFVLSFKGMREIMYMQKKHTEAVRRRMQENYANVYRMKGSAPPAYNNYSHFPGYGNGVFYTNSWLSTVAPYYHKF